MMKSILTLMICVSFVGCSMMPKYVRPHSPVANEWPFYEADNAILIGKIRGSTFFNDARLRKLIELSLKNNRDLRLAALNVELLRVQYKAGLARGFPNVDAIGSGVRQRDVTSDEGGLTSGKYSLRAGITAYELDLFGRVRSLRAAALQQYLASQEARRSVQIALIAQVGIQYLTERALQEQLIQTHATLQSVQDYYDLIKGSYDVGNASQLDVRSAQAQVENARVQVASLERVQKQAINALVLLIGEPIPDDLPEAELFSSQRVLTNIPPGLPSDLIAHRPDILAAEYQLKGANANIGAARAAFFPKITLTGSGGIASVKLMDLFTGGTVWSFAPQITMPIFDAGANKANLEVAKIRKSIEVAQYEKVIQIAFREVADALSAQTSLDEQIQAQGDLVVAQQQRYDLADVRYRNGVDSLLTVLIAQQELYSAKQNLIQSQLLRFSNLILLYKALGGGWDEYALSP
jgi:multidrug efflux system outer membrane protein